jgi:polyhydroxybutyrate depolymerase
VRPPPTYDATQAHPLVMVYAPAGANASQTEGFTKLTPDAHARGWIIAYVDHISPTSTAVADDAALIGEKWCVDPARIYLTGHSDGGSIATLVALVTDLAPTAIAPSAAGANAMFLNGQLCPAPVPVMVLHSSNDQLFPGFGAEAADYWQACNECQPAGPPQADGCVVYGGCAAGVEVQYCEGSGSHGTWPPLNESMLAFFDRFAK